MLKKRKKQIYGVKFKKRRIAAALEDGTHLCWAAELM